MPEEAQYAYMATRSALENAKLDQDYTDRNEIGIIYGNDSVAEATMQALDKFREFKDTSACGSGAIFQSMNSTVTMNLACLFKLRGINLTASAACASGSQAIGLAYTLIRSGCRIALYAAVLRKPTYTAWLHSTASNHSLYVKTIPPMPAVRSTATVTVWYPVVVRQQ